MIVIKKIALLLISIVAVLLLAANIAISKYSSSTTDAISALPQQHACLVLGTSTQRADASPSLFFAYRINAAYAVYSSGKCKIIVVSGKVVGGSYNEPDAMKNSLIAKGVPASAIVGDYGGGRTLDSVLRFKTVFGQTSGIVISQQFHSTRAIYIASHNAIALTGYNAQDVNFRNAYKAHLRELFARVLAILDVHLLHTQPKDADEKFPI